MYLHRAEPSLPYREVSFIRRVFFQRSHCAFLMYIFQGEEREGMAEEIKVVAVADPAKQVHTYAGPRRTFHQYNVVHRV